MKEQILSIWPRPMCYAWFYVSEHNLPEAAVQMTYCSLETEEIRRFKTVKTAMELEGWFQGLLHEYMKWARYLYHNAVPAGRISEGAAVSLCLTEMAREIWRYLCTGQSAGEGSCSFRRPQE